MQILLTTLNAKYIHSSLALRSLRAYLDAVIPETKIQVQVKEYSINNNLPDILADIYPHKPDLIGLACYIWNIEETLKLASLLKKTLPETKIALGGPEVSYGFDSISETNYPAFNYIDYIISGEGEKTFASLISALLTNGDKSEKLTAIPGLLRRQDGELKGNALPQIIESLDIIPFPYNSGDLTDLKDKIIYYESSRGCPFSCQYCLSSATSGIRFLSLDRVFKELEFFISHDVKQIKFVDRTFNAVKSHYIPIIKFLAGQKCRTNFHFEAAADIWDEEALEILKTAPPGRFQLEIGVQSTNIKTLEAIKRYNNFESIAKNVRRLKKSGNIHLHLDLIAGLPYENFASFSKSFDDVYALEPNLLQIGFLKLLRGSGLRKKAGEHGYVFMDNSPYEVLSNNYLSYNDLRRFKLLENVFDLTYNSSRFCYSLKWLIKEIASCDSAFSFYEKLSVYWEKQGWQYLAHSVNSLYQYLSGFCQSYWPHLWPVFLEFLKFDFLITQKWFNCPEFLHFNEPSTGDADSAKTLWREEKKSFWQNTALVRLYLPEFTFNTWREVKKNYHIEVFSVDIPAFIRDEDRLEKKKTAVLFSVKESGIKSKEVVFQTLEGENFPFTGQVKKFSPSKPPSFKNFK